MIEYNVELLNRNDLENSFFHVSREDPTAGFPYDATKISGPTFPSASDLTGQVSIDTDPLYMRLLVASHLAGHLRHQLEHVKGYTATVGISTCKVLSKLVGNVHKPNGQTTLLPPYSPGPHCEGSNVLRFLDPYEIRGIPGIGSKLARSLRVHLSGSGPNSSDSKATDDKVTVQDVRLFPGMGPEVLENILGGPGSPKGIGMRVWNLIHGIDDSDILEARDFPTQISIEDSYLKLDTFEGVKKELVTLTTSLIRRMRTDLIELESHPAAKGMSVSSRKSPQSATRWIAHPKTLRLSTRPRSSSTPPGTRTYSVNRISRSAPLPQFVFNLEESVEALTDRLVQEALIGMFRKLHPQRSGWNLSLLNIAVTNMVQSAGEQKRSNGRDIGQMFQRQETVLKEWRVSEPDAPDAGPLAYKDHSTWEESDEDEVMPSITCGICGASIPRFAQVAHEVYHAAPYD